MSMKKQDLEILIHQGKYFYELVKEGTFKGAKSAVLVNEYDRKTLPTRLLICDCCGTGYEEYLNKMNDLFRSDDKLVNQFYCKKCTIQKPIKEIEQQIESMLLENKDKLKMFAEQATIQFDDIIYEYLKKEVRKYINDEVILKNIDEILENCDKKFDEKVKELFEKIG